MSDAAAGSVSERTPTEYGQWFARGLEHQKADKPIDALVCYQRALTANPYAIQARYRLGQVLRDLGKDREARATWRAGLALQPGHVPLQLCLARAARRAGEYDEAIGIYREILAVRSEHSSARLGLALCRLARGEDDAYDDLAQMPQEIPRRWDDLIHALEAVGPSSRRRAFLSGIGARRSVELPPALLALIAEEAIDAGDSAAASETLAEAARRAPAITNPELLRRFARVGAALHQPEAWSERYAHACTAAVPTMAPLMWPRRTAGEALRVAYLVPAGGEIRIGGVTLRPESFLSAIVARHAPERIKAALYVIGDASIQALPASVPVVALGAAPLDASVARAIAEIDPDALVDLVGVRAPVGGLLALRPARSVWTYAALHGAHVAPLIDHVLPEPHGGDAATLAEHRPVLESALLAGCAGARTSRDAGARSAAELSGLWRSAVAAHQAGEVDRALAAYREVLADQTGYAPAHYLLGMLLRDLGRREAATTELAAAVAAAPRYVEARVALANHLRDSARVAEAVALCEAGLALLPGQVAFWRALGQAQLAQREAEPARQAFGRALELEGTDATTHYNQGVALHMLNRRAAALRAYQRALVLDPGLSAADFNIGVIFREQGHADAAIKAFEQVLEREPRHAPAHKALAETLLEGRRLEEWFRAFDRFEAACPNALPMACLALEACQYRGDFAALDRYIDRISRDDFKPSSETELVDCLEVLLFLLLYFDVDPDVHYGLYETYNKAVPNVYGKPLALPATRRPGRLRIGYLSADLRNHVMGKMMWSALQHHDRDRFELYFYSLSTATDEWTERYRGLAQRFENIAHLSERKAAERIAADELDILVDLGTHTHSSKPGILALKPARVQVTHVASAGVVGLSTIDFKLTDAFADLPEMQRFQIETLLPMEGCVYPYRSIPPADDHPYHREKLGIAADAVVASAFVNPLKLSRRCLTLWRQVLEAIPNALLAISPLSPERRDVYARLLQAAGIEESRVCVLPQGRNESQNQARYHVVDFALDPLPYGGANGTLEALSMGVPVVTLLGAKHGERCGYSMLANLGAVQTVAASGSQYVEIALRLATDRAFMAEVRAAIRAGLRASPLTDMVAHTHSLERAYVRALELRYPAALVGSDD